jgi:outer membrane protein TolC
MNLLNSVFLVPSAVCLLVLMNLTASGDEPSNAEDTTARIRKLQQERVDVLQRAVNLVLIQFKEGEISFNGVHEIQRDLLDARLEMAETRGEKIKGLESHLKFAKGALRLAEGQAAAGKTDQVAVYLAKSDVLSIEIQLLKLREF